jgi:hypothetical protein
MENNSPDREPVSFIDKNVLEGKPIVEPRAELITENNQEVKPKKSILFPILTVFLIIGTFFLGYFFNQTVPETSENKEVEQNKIAEQNNQSPTASVSTTKQEIKTEFLFTKDPNQDVSYDLQAWILPLDGEAQQIFLPDFSVAFKYPNNSKIFFLENKAPSSNDFDGFISVKDLTNNETKKYELIKHPKLEVNESISINNLNNIAPDGSMLVYGVFFSEPCPPITMEPGFEGGFGPCEPSPEPSLPNGDYIYDFVSKTNISFGESITVSKWDLENKKLYFIGTEYQKNGLKVMDLETKQISMVNKASTFGYGATPLLKSNFIVKIDGQTGNVSGQNSSSVLSLYNLDTKETKVLDSGRWAEIQPFVSVSPDEGKFIYIRSMLDSQGRAIYSLHSYDFKTGQIKRVTPESKTSSYSIHDNWWLDENIFITSVNETDSNYNNGKNYLVKIDLVSEQMTKLTDDGVYRFN